MAQMLTCMDDLSEQPLAGGTDGDGGTERGDPRRLPKHVVVIGAAALLDLSPGQSEADLQDFEVSRILGCNKCSDHWALAAL